MERTRENSLSKQKQNQQQRQSEPKVSQISVRADGEICIDGSVSAPAPSKRDKKRDKERDQKRDKKRKRHEAQDEGNSAHAVDGTCDSDDKGSGLGYWLGEAERADLAQSFGVPDCSAEQQVRWVWKRAHAPTLRDAAPALREALDRIKPEKLKRMKLCGPKAPSEAVRVQARKEVRGCLFFERMLQELLELGAAKCSDASM